MHSTSLAPGLRPRPLLPILASLVAALALVAPPGAAAEPQWADAEAATITPGVQMVTAGSQCTANYVFTDGVDVYLGYAAHCAGTGAATDTNGCTAGTLPVGTTVDIEGATRDGELVYSSWVTMQSIGEQDGDVCAYNDFALVRLDPADHERVNPSVPFWGGPIRLGSGTSAGETVYSYGNSSLRLGLDPLKPKQGTSLGESGGGWSHVIYTATPGIPGDSGSGVLDDDGEAVGVLSTLAVAPLTGSNNATDLASALHYLRAHTDLDGVALVAGTEPFSPLLP